MEKKIYLQSFHLAGFAYYDGCACFGDLRIGTELCLRREPECKYDPDAVAIYYGEFKLGYVPAEANEMLSKFLDLGHGELFEARVNRLSPDSHPAKQVGVTVFMKNRACLAGSLPERGGRQAG